MRLALVLLAASVTAPFAPIQAEEAHVHGEATLDVVLDDEGALFELHVPAIDVLGFERAPANDTEQAQVDAALAKFEDFGALFTIFEEAECVPSLAEAELDVNEAHAEFHVAYDLTCNAPGKLTWIEVDAFKVFPDITVVDAAVVTPTGQTGGELTLLAKRLTF